MVSFGDIVYYGGSNEYFIKKDIVAKDASMIEFLDLVFSKKHGGFAFSRKSAVFFIVLLGTRAAAG